MLSRLFQHIFGRKKSPDLTDADLDRMDVAYEESLTELDYEKVMVEDGEVVGTTAVLDCQGVTPIDGKHPADAQPPFEEDESDLVNAGKCTAFLMIEEKQADGTRRVRQFGTAFFITEKHLLTAGHNVIDRHGNVRHPKITYPGLNFIDIKRLREGRINMLDCRVVDTLHKKDGPYNKDIAILECPGHTAADRLSLSSELLHLGATVDIIGYPGAIKEEWMERHASLTDYIVSKRETEHLLPTRSLTVTRGKVQGYNGALIAYKISTCPGLSGGPMLHKGKVYGVHVGQHALEREDCLPLALSFIPMTEAGPNEVYRLLRRRGVIA